MLLYRRILNLGNTQFIVNGLWSIDQCFFVYCLLFTVAQEDGKDLRYVETHHGSYFVVQFLFCKRHKKNTNSICCFSMQQIWKKTLLSPTILSFSFKNNFNLFWNYWLLHVSRQRIISLAKDIPGNNHFLMGYC